MKSYRKNFLLLFILTFALSCNAPVQEEVQPANNPYKQLFIEANRYTRDRHRQHIMAFTERVGWDMNETSTGLWYMITDEGKGPPVLNDKMVHYSYETRLLTGKICYAADTTNPEKIVIGKGEIESGLKEGLLMLREGSKATFIIPPYLAHGNFGDGNKIPGSSVLLVDVYVQKVIR
ncbi:MAG: FKBP-type peptidyl-prolyl cis-trans isomerase [Bacteroidales bacterium]|nr:FKBP-type peptidyl-prolyl cis-trans isomerase [Bacteroidales bacterium]